MKNLRADDRLLTRAEVEERFGVPRRFLERSIHRRDGPPFVRVGRSVRYRTDDLLDWINRNRIDPSAPHTGVPSERLGGPAGQENGVQAVTQTKTLTNQNKNAPSGGRTATTGER